MSFRQVLLSQNKVYIKALTFKLESLNLSAAEYKLCLLAQLSKSYYIKNTLSFLYHHSFFHLQKIAKKERNLTVRFWVVIPNMLTQHHQKFKNDALILF